MCVLTFLYVPAVENDHYIDENLVGSNQVLSDIQSILYVSIVQASIEAGYVKPKTVYLDSSYQKRLITLNRIKIC